MREKINFCSGWLFHKGDIKREYPPRKNPVYMSCKTERALWGPAAKNYNDRCDSFDTSAEVCTEDWVGVTIPHDYTIRTVPQENNNPTLGFFEQENAWYRKHFKLSEEDKDKVITIYFEAAATSAEVWINGCLAARHFGGYTPFSVNITDFIDYGKDNILAVYLDNSMSEGWWYSGGGIYRPVWMIKTNKVAVDTYGVYVHPQKISDSSWEVPIEVTVKNDSKNTVTADISVEIISEDGKVWANATEKAEIEPFNKSVANLLTRIDNPLIWDCETPNLYTAKTTITVNGVAVDNVENKFGFRTLEYTANEGFFLNGKHRFIKGVCCHQDYGLTGKAVPERVQEYRLEILKEMGANGYRTAHYPHSEYTMDCLDRMGFLVMDETRWFTTNEEGIEAVETMVKRDRNHPCVVYWSIGNEEPLSTNENGCRIAAKMSQAVKRLDNTRAITSALCHSPATSPAAGELDVIGVNYNLDHFDRLHEKYPDKPLVGSECCAVPTTRGWYKDTDNKRGYFSAFDLGAELSQGREKTWQFYMSHPYICGCYQWAGIEHRGEAGFWPRLCSASGAVDLYLQKKDSFYQNQSHWLDKPMIHLLPKWNFKGMDGEIINVWAYTNCEEAELFLNGKSISRIKVEKYSHASWTVPYAPGKLEVIGYNGGKKSAYDLTETPDKPYALKLVLENSDIKTNDYAILTCYCVDEKGRVVTDAAPYVSFSTNKYGYVVATGANNTDHVPPYHTDRRLWNGCCSILVKTGGNSGKLIITASSDNLENDILKIEI